MANTTAIHDMREAYYSNSKLFLEESIKTQEPLALFKEWFTIASTNQEIKEPNAMALATATKNGRPSLRFVLLKEFGKTGFYFFTNLKSRKACELAENPFAALTFYWDPIHRQVRIEGTVEQVDDDEAEKYFQQRPRSSQISAHVSEQSKPITSREVLIKRQRELEELYNDQSKPIPKPTYWGGYRVIPDVIEFWQGQTNRLHDRIRFRRLLPGEEITDPSVYMAEDGWVRQRLCP